MLPQYSPDDSLGKFFFYSLERGPSSFLTCFDCRGSQSGLDLVATKGEMALKKMGNVTILYFEEPGNKYNNFNIKIGVQYIFFQTLLF